MFRRSELISNTSHNLTIAVICLATIIIFTTGAAAQQATIRIDTVMDQSLGQNTWVNIILDPGAEPFSPRYFSFVIGYEAMTPYTLNYHDCVWPTTVRFDTNTDCSNGYCPEGLLRVTVRVGSSYCPIDSFDEPTVLLSIGFSLQGDVGEFYPLRFVWTDCNDNIGSTSEYWELDTLLISRLVYDYDGSPITMDQPMFSHTGAPSDCYGYSGPDTLRLRGLDFQNGGIGISYVDSIQTPRAAISIEKSHSTPLGSIETLGITLDEIGPEPIDIAGFDFLISYDPVVLSFMSAEPGQLLQDCGWEYFQYRIDTIGLVRIVAVAEINNGDNHPTCFADAPGELASISFLVTSDYHYECIYSPVRWWWADCGDNAVSGPMGDTLFLSNNVFDYDDGPPIQNNHDLPSHFGAPTSCILDSSGGSIGIRAIDYTHGGIDIVCADSIDFRGDINLNGIPNEIADWVLFSNYFFYGPAVFSVNWEMQAAASDVNVDGIELTLWDLVYLYRIIMGDALPYLSPPKAGIGDTVFLVQDTVAKTITVNYPDSLSALMLYFDSEIMMTTTLPNHSIGGPDSLTTRVMVFPNLDFSVILPTIANGQVFEYTGNGNLIDALAAYNGLSFLEAAVVGGGMSDCCVIRGDVDHSGEMVQISDLVALVKYLFVFDDSFEPPCLEEANVDGLPGTAGPVDLSDLIFMVDYMFNGGAPIPPCPVQ